MKTTKRSSPLAASMAGLGSATNKARLSMATLAKAYRDVSVAARAEWSTLADRAGKATSGLLGSLAKRRDEAQLASLEATALAADAQAEAIELLLAELPGQDEQAVAAEAPASPPSPAPEPAKKARRTKKVEPVEVPVAEVAAAAEPVVTAA